MDPELLRHTIKEVVSEILKQSPHITYAEFIAISASGVALLGIILGAAIKLSQRFVEGVKGEVCRELQSLGRQVDRLAKEVDKKTSIDDCYKNMERCPSGQEFRKNVQHFMEEFWRAFHRHNHDEKSGKVIRTD